MIELICWWEGGGCNRKFRGGGIRGENVSWEGGGVFEGNGVDWEREMIIF